MKDGSYMKTFYKSLIILFILLIPINVFSKEFDIESERALLVNLNEDKFLYEKNIESKTKIASITKIMTAIVVLENVDDLSKKVQMTSADFKGLAALGLQTSGLKVNKSYTYEELLYGPMLPSGADCANALSRLVAGNVPKFVDMMNEKAKELGMEKTNFTNPIGLDEKGSFSTAKDVYIMYKYALENEIFKKITNTMEKKVGDVKLNHTINYYIKKHDLKMDYLLGGKTGTETLAGYCLATTATYNGVDYMLITLNAPYSYSVPYHFLDTKLIYDYYMKNYGYQTLLKENELIITLNTRKIKEEKLEITSKKDYSYYMENNYDKEKINIVYDGVYYVDTSFKKGTKLGEVKIYYGDTLLEKEDIYLEEKLHFSIINFFKDDSIALYSVCFLSLFAILIYIKSKDTKDIEIDF